uniref:Nuclear receptor subfamily 1 group I member 2 n=1 Tax=Leptobrachium leishanense TaxID=445787 RepID=A0A8C5MFY7_9ANUR
MVVVSLFMSCRSRISSCFRRAIKRNLRLSCPFQNSCVINRNNRRHCQACRLKKCLDIGMKKELIMSDEAVEQRRALIKKKQQLCQPSPGLLTSTFTEEQRKLVTDLLDAHNKTFDFNFVHFRNFRPIRRSMDTGDSSSSKEYLMLPHISDLISYMIKGVIDFAKVIPYFRNLSIEDQIALLKGSSIELCIIRFNMVFNVEKRIWECGSNTYSFDDLILAGYRIPFLEPLIHFHCMLKKLKLHKEEYVLMEALSLFSGDRPGVCENQVIDGVQEFFAMTLMAYIETQRAPSQENRSVIARDPLLLYWPGRVPLVKNPISQQVAPAVIQRWSFFFLWLGVHINRRSLFLLLQVPLC